MKVLPLVVGTGLISLDIVVEASSQQLVGAWAGGTCGNVVAILSYLGWRAIPLGRLGSDPAFMLVSEDLRRWGVGLDYLALSPGGPTPIIVQHLVPGPGRRTHVFSHACLRCGANLPRFRPVTRDATRMVTGEIDDPSVFFLDRLSPQAIDLAREWGKKGTLVMFEPSSIGDTALFADALSATHVLKYSRERIQTAPERDSDQGPLLEIQTCGDAGLYFRSRLESCSQEWVHLPAVPVAHVRDTAGAGDWCTAGLLNRLGRRGLADFAATEESVLRDALMYGQKLGAWSCAFAGARGGMYEMERENFPPQFTELLEGYLPTASRAASVNGTLVSIFQNVCTVCASQLLRPQFV